MGDFGALIAGVKATADIARSVRDVNDQARINTAVAEMMDKLMDVQGRLATTQVEHLELIEEAKQLKEQVASEQRFERYRLEKTPMGGYVMPLKDEYVTTDCPPHVICHHCRESGRVSIMNEASTQFSCKACGYVARRARRDYGSRPGKHPGFM